MALWLSDGGLQHAAGQDCGYRITPHRTASAFSASKAAVTGPPKSPGKEQEATEVRVNRVTIAAVRTPIFNQMAPQQIDWMLSKVPFARFGESKEGDVPGPLAGPERGCSTGAAFDVSGGRATHGARPTR